MKKPKVFVSSTVLDFEDLRGALKYYLESFGYEVQMSEYPNFKISPDNSVFDNCRNSIMDCQYFILLIGYRRGGWYKKDELSITNYEYRIVKKLIEEGKQIKIISFIRKPLWVLKNDREQIVSYMKEKQLEHSDIVRKIGTIAIDDPEYIFNFINEVNRGIKLKEGEEPTNNWIYDFSTFEEVVTALKYAFKIDTTLEEKKIKSLLENELWWNSLYLGRPNPLIENFDATNLLCSLHAWEISTYEFYKNYYKNNIEKLKRNDSKFIFTKNEFQEFRNVTSKFIRDIKSIKTNIMRKILDQGLYLIYDNEKNKYKEDDKFYEIERLVYCIEDANLLLESDIFHNFEKEIMNIELLNPKLEVIELTNLDQYVHMFFEYDTIFKLNRDLLNNL